MDQERRANPRFAFGLHCTIRVRAGQARPVKLIDVSLDGCRLESNFKLQQNDLAWLELGSLRGVAGTIMWSSEAFCGMQFSSPLHESILADLLRSQPTPYQVDVGTLFSLSERSAHDAAHAFRPHEIENLGRLAKDCEKAAVINRLVQGLRSADATTGRV